MQSIFSPLIRSLLAALALTAPAYSPAASGGRPDVPIAPVRPSNELQLSIARFDQTEAPRAHQLHALRALNLQVQGFKRLPLAYVRGTAPQLQAAIQHGLVAAIYPDAKLDYLSRESNGAIGADAVHLRGFTGRGVQVAIVDSGIDASHPDLAQRVVHNVKIVGPEYANLPPDAPPGSLVVSFDEGPYSNTDPAYGHGTHVAGIVAADGTTDPSQTGVAPDADLIGYSTGEITYVRTILAAFDHILDHPEWGVDVVNNSWGLMHSAFFDPLHPMNVATKALADRGIVVVFAAGNWGYDWMRNMRPS